MVDLMLGIGAAVGASTLYSLGIALQAMDAREAPHDEHLRLALAWGLLRRTRWLLGGRGHGEGEGCRSRIPAGQVRLRCGAAHGGNARIPGRSWGRWLGVVFRYGTGRVPAGFWHILVISRSCLVSACSLA